MLATVEAYLPESKALVVRTSTGHIGYSYPWTDEEYGDLTYYPIRPGYASTILKFQGAELEHVIAYLDAPNIPAAASDAPSRVEL